MRITVLLCWIFCCPWGMLLPFEQIKAQEVNSQEVRPTDVKIDILEVTAPVGVQEQEQEPEQDQEQTQEHKKEHKGFLSYLWKKLDFTRSENLQKKRLAAGISVLQGLSGMLGSAILPATLSQQFYGDREFSYELRRMGNYSSMAAFLLNVPDILKVTMRTFSHPGVYCDKFFTTLNLAGHALCLGGFGVLAEAHDLPTITLGGCLLAGGTILKTTNLLISVAENGLDETLGTDPLLNKRGRKESIFFNLLLKSITPTLGNCALATCAIAAAPPYVIVSAGGAIALGLTLGNIPDLLRSISTLKGLLHHLDDEPDSP